MTWPFILGFGAAYIIGSMGSKLARRGPHWEAIECTIHLSSMTAILAFWTWWYS